MKNTMIRSALCLFALMFGAIGISHGYLPVVSGDSAAFTFARGDTLWDIWSEHGVVSWSEFYDASARLNPQHTHDRFRSVAVGSAVSVPLSFLSINPIIVAETSLMVPGPVEPLVSLVTEEQFRELQTQTLTLSGSVAGITTALQSLERVVTEQMTASEDNRTLGLNSLIWAIIAAALFVLLLTALVILFLQIRINSAHTVTVADVGKELQLTEEIVRQTKEHENLLVEQLRLTEMIRSLRNENEILKAEKAQLEGELSSIIGQEHVADGDNNTQRTRRGTHGGGRPYT